MKLTLKQIAFCKEISLGKSAAEAYKIAYKSSSDGTCKVNGSKMLKNAQIAEKIKEFQDQNYRITEKAINKAASELAKGEFADVAERKLILTKILRGELEIEQEVATNTGVKIVRLKPDFNERKGAIAELNKMDGSYAPSKSEVENKGAIRVIRE